jgi:hypothetical protein
MVYSILNHCDYALCLSSGIVNNYKTRRFGNWITFRLQVREIKHVLCWIPQKERTSTTRHVAVGCS